MLDAVLQFAWNNPLTTIFAVGGFVALIIFTNVPGTTGPG